MSPKWTLCKTRFSIPPSIEKLSKPYSQGCICHKSHCSTARKVRARSNKCNKSRATGHDIKYDYYWHTVTAAFSSFTVNLQQCEGFFFNALVKKTEVEKMLLSGLATHIIQPGSAHEAENHKINRIHKMGSTHLCTSFSKRWVEPLKK